MRTYTCACAYFLSISIKVCEFQERLVSLCHVGTNRLVVPEIISRRKKLPRSVRLPTSSLLRSSAEIRTWTEVREVTVAGNAVLGKMNGAACDRAGGVVQRAALVIPVLRVGFCEGGWGEGRGGGRRAGMTRCCARAPIPTTRGRGTGESSVRGPGQVRSAGRKWERRGSQVPRPGRAGGAHNVSLPPCPCLYPNPYPLSSGSFTLRCDANLKPSSCSSSSSLHRPHLLLTAMPLALSAGLRMREEGRPRRPLPEACGRFEFAQENEKLENWMYKWSYFVLDITRTDWDSMIYKLPVISLAILCRYGRREDRIKVLERKKKNLLITSCLKLNEK